MGAKQVTSHGHKLDALAAGEGAGMSCAWCRPSAPVAFGATMFYTRGGKSGTVTKRWRAVCRPCAVAFAAEHGLTMPAAG